MDGSGVVGFLTATDEKFDDDEGVGLYSRKFTYI